MKEEVLFAAIGDLDDTIIDEAEGIPFRKRTGLKAAAAVLACAACVTLILVTGIKWSAAGSPDRPAQIMSEATVPTKIASTEPPIAKRKHHVTFLHALGDGSQKTELIENVKLPYRTLIRTRDISGMDDDQLTVVIEAEQDFIEGFFSQYPEDALNCWGRYKGDDVLITTLSAGSFILQLDEPEAVESIEISVTDTGKMSLHQRIEGYRCSTFKHHSIYLDAKGLEQALQQSEQGLTMFWNISNPAASMIKEDPSFPLSDLKDTITIRVVLKDGSAETCSIDMIADDSGNVYAVYRGTTVTA